MSFWSAYAWTALVVANWLVVGYTVLWVRRDISDSRPPRASWLIPAATPGEPESCEVRQDALSVPG